AATVRRFHTLKAQLHRLRAALPGDDGGAFVSEGAALADTLDEAAALARETEIVRRDAVREAAEQKASLIEAFRRLDRWADEAAMSGRTVPGRSRDVLKHWAATRPAMR